MRLVIMARQHAPHLGLWTSRDPLGEAGGLNLYAYVGNNPVNWVDPWGLVIAPDGGNSVQSTFNDCLAEPNPQMRIDCLEMLQIAEPNWCEANNVSNILKSQYNTRDAWMQSNPFLNWLKGNRSLSIKNNPISHDEAREILKNANKLKLKVDLNLNGLKGLERTGQWKGIPHFKIGDVHIPVQKGFTP